MRIFATVIWLLLGLATAQAQCTSALVDNATRTGSTGTTSTITGAAFGTAFAGRVLVDVFTAGEVPATATIGGVSAVVNVADPTNPFGLMSAVVPTGTSGNLVQTYSTSDQLTSYGIVALIGAASATPISTIQNNGGGSGTINVPAGGCVVAFALATSSGSWTGATAVRTDTSQSPLVLSIATFDNSGGALTGRTISYSTGLTLVAAAFDAGGSPPVTTPHRRTLMGIGN